MKTIVRVGGLMGGIGFVVLYAAQTGIALAVAPGVALVGLCAGLGIAKWLEREWYGRQLNAGLRAGAIASGTAGIGALLSLLFLGPRDSTLLATRSHLAGLDLAPIPRAFGFLGWVGADVIAVALAALLGTALAATACQVFAWSKSKHAIEVVTQARLAAQALNRDEVYRATGAPASAYGIASPTSNLLAPFGASLPGAASMTGITPALGVIPPPTFSPSSVPAPASQERTTAAPALASTPAAPPSISPAERTPVDPAVPAASAPDPTPNRAALRRSPSAARRAEAELTEAMRDALAAWADDTTAEPQNPTIAGETAKPVRAPAPSAYLNSSPPARRGRKKTDTQDWLC